MDTDIRQLIARVAVAMMAADGRIEACELDALQRLDALGLGPLSCLALDEIDRATYAPIDLDATCDALAVVGPDAAAFLVSALAGVAVSDRRLSAREGEVFNAVAAHLGLGGVEAACILESAIAAAEREGVTDGDTAVAVLERHA